jgi:enoyl-CoA hydratase
VSSLSVVYWCGQTVAPFLENGFIKPQLKSSVAPRFTLAVHYSVKPMKMNHNTIVVAKNNAIGRITFSRPHRLNAVTAELYKEVEAAITEFEGDQEIRVVVITGEGRAFCVGADLKEHASQDRSDEEKHAYAVAEQTVCGKILLSPRLFIAAVNGYALGAGAEMAIACDFVIMKNSAEIGFPEVSIGTYLGGGVTSLLPSLVGLAKAKELVMRGNRINGAEAKKIGLILDAVPDDQFSGAVESFAQELAAKAPISALLAKRHLLEHRQVNLSMVMQNEVDGLLRCFASEDWVEGVQAFKEKRKPKFHGR